MSSIFSAPPSNDAIKLDQKSEPTVTVAALPSEPEDPEVTSQLNALRSLLLESEIIAPGHPEYLDESSTWSTTTQQHPSLVVRPSNVESVSKVLKFLGESTLDFEVRNSGCGGASAKHVILSTRALTDFEFDRENEILTIGAGSLWSEYYDKMEKEAPEYAVVAAATPFIGVGGSILAGGFSIMSKEYGCSSDPENLLDAEVVKLDGSVVWASSEPDLLWGLRGAYIGLGVVTKFKLRARKYPQQIWGGHIIIPKAKEAEVAKGVAAMDAGEVPKSLFALLVPLPEVIILNAFDALGQEHGREAFGWAINIEGAVDTTRVMNLRQFAEMQAPAVYGKNVRQVWWNPLALPRLSEELLMKSFEWNNKAENMDRSIMYELFGVRGSSAGKTGSAWPRPESTRHFLMLSSAAPSDASEAEVKRAKDIIQAGPIEILGHELDESLIATSALDQHHNTEAIYGENWAKIVELKKKYDPKGQFHSAPLAKQLTARLNLS